MTNRTNTSAPLLYLVDHAQASIADSPASEQYRCLFVLGSGGAGKSTLIKALIRDAALNATAQATVADGRVEGHTCACENVRLYSNSETVDVGLPSSYAGMSSAYELEKLIFDLRTVKAFSVMMFLQQFTLRTSLSAPLMYIEGLSSSLLTITLSA